MEDLKQSDRRRNVLEIIADLGARDHKDQTGPTLTLVPPPSSAKASGASPAADNDIVNTLSEAQRRAAEQRAAAEALLKESLVLEQRLAEEVEQARKANDHALAQQLQSAIAASVADEQKAAEQAEGWQKKLERIVAEKQAAEALQGDDRRAIETAKSDIAAAEKRLAEAQRALEIATTSCTESDRRFGDACKAEEAARREADEAARVVATHRDERRALEEQLQEVQKRAQGFSGNGPSMNSIEQLRGLETKRRLAERRASDLARGAAS
jgi:chromosome segregation ATPase